MSSNDKNDILKLIPPVAPVTFPKEKKKWEIKKIAHRTVTRQFITTYEQAMALNGGQPSTHIEKLIIDEIIKKFQELRTIL